MAEFPTAHTGITGTYQSYDNDTGQYSYVLKNAESGAEETVTSAYPLEDTIDSKGERKPGFRSLMGPDFQSPAGQELASTLAPAFRKFQYRDKRGFFGRGIAPILRSLVGGPYFFGAIPEFLTLLSYIPGPDTLLEMGYEGLTGETPRHLKQTRLLAQEARKTLKPYTSKAQQVRFERWLRQADEYAHDQWGFRPFASTVGTDMTPAYRGTVEKSVVTMMEMGLSGIPMVKGVTVPAKVLQGLYKSLAKRSVDELGEAALKPENIRSLIDKASDRSLIDKASDFYAMGTKKGRKNIGVDVAFGVTAGAFTEGSLAALQEIDPEASGLVKTLTAIGSGLVGPVALYGTFTGLLQVPGVYKYITTKVIDPWLRPSRSAELFTQKYALGASDADKVEILEVGRVLEEAYTTGRGVDKVSGLAFTVPELARSEANILRARSEIKRDELATATDPAVKERLAQEIAEAEKRVSSLNRYASFQEDILEAAARDPSPGAAKKFFDDEAQRLVKRRDQFFNYIENQFKQSVDDISFGGKDGGTPNEHRLDFNEAVKTGAIPEFEATRRKLVMRGNLKGIEPSELQWLTPSMRDQVDNSFATLDANMEKAFNKAKEAADRRVTFWKDGIDDLLAERGLTSIDDLPRAERNLVGDLIRGTYDDAYRELRGFEKAAYRRVKGIDEKVTENIEFPPGSTDFDGTSIAGMTVADWAARRLDNLTPSQRYNPGDVPGELVQLAGMRSIIAYLNKRQSLAGGKADAEAGIPHLEKVRDDAITRRVEVDERIKRQEAEDRGAAEQQHRALQTYVEGATAKLDDTQTAAVNAFTDDIDINWETQTQQMAKDRAPKGLASIFASISKQKRNIAELGEGTLRSKALRKLDTEAAKFSDAALKAQGKIDQTTARFLEGMEVAPITSAGRLAARNADGELVSGGTSAQDLKDTISDIAESASKEVRINGKTVKYRNFIQLRTTLEQLLTTAVFPNLDPAALSFANQASQLMHRVGAAQADILARVRGADVKVPVEVVVEKVLPDVISATKQAANVRLLRTATADVPDFVTIKRDADGKVMTDAEGIPIAVIDESAIGGKSLFELPGSPFESVSPGKIPGGFSEIRLRPNAPVTDRSLQLAESILLERLALQFPDGVDSKSLASFRANNKAAIQFLKNNGRQTIPELVNDADALATQMNALNSLFRDRTRRQLTELVENGHLDLGGNTIDDYLKYIGQRRSRMSEENAFKTVLEADPGRATNTLFDRILDPKNSKPKTDLQEFLSLVRVDKQAEKGFKASVIGELFRRATTGTDALVVALGDVSARVFDPTLFRELMADQRIRMLLQEVFPDNKAFLDGLDKVAVVAFETANFTKGSKRFSAAIDPQTALSMEAYSNLGRLLGLNVAARIDFISPLVAAGAGSRAGTQLGKNLTGSKIKNILVEAALDIPKAIELSKATAAHIDGFLATLRRASIDVVTAPVVAPLRHPAPGGRILQQGEERLDEETRFGPRRRPQASRTPIPRNLVPESTLALAKPFGAPRPLAATDSPRPRVTPENLRDMGMDLFSDPNFNKGGIVSIRKKKPRQMVY